MKSLILPPQGGKEDSRLAYIMLAMAGCIYIMAAIWWERLGYGGDSFAHYLISRYSWKHPELFLDNWGKPFFTLLTSPFTQFGWVGMLTFNVICGIMTAYVIWLSCKRAGLSDSWMSIPLFVFVPVHLVQIPTGLTEPLFACMVAISGYLFLREKYVLGSLLISFLPFVRTEGVGILPVFLLALFLVRQVRKAPLLAAGIVAFLLSEYLFKGQISWIRAGGYNVQSIVYGMKGTWGYYFKAAPFLFGPVLTFLVISGMVYIVYELFRKRSNLYPADTRVLTAVLMTGSFVVLFASYAAIWAMGILDVIGDTRYMATIVPGAVVTGMFGVKAISEKLGEKRKRLTRVVSIVICILALMTSCRMVGLPGGLSREQVITKEAAQWLKESGYSKNKIYHFNPILPVELDLDPYDTNRMDALWALRKESPPQSAVIFWDSHFGLNEMKLPLENLMRSPDLVLVKSFVPEKSFSTLKGVPFEIHVFQKRSGKSISLYGSD